MKEVPEMRLLIFMEVALDVRMMQPDYSMICRKQENRGRAVWFTIFKMCFLRGLKQLKRFPKTYFCINFRVKIKKLS